MKKVSEDCTGKLFVFLIMLYPYFLLFSNLFSLCAVSISSTVVFFLL